MPPPNLSPDVFAQSALQMPIYPWQADVLQAVGRGWPAALLAINGSGKSSTVIVAAVLWFISEHPTGRCVITSGSWSQLKAQIFDNIRRFSHRPLFKGYEFLESSIRTPKGGLVTGLSVEDSFRAEGWHRSDDSPLMIVLDEGKAVQDSVYDSLDKCLASYRLYCSSAGPASGRFYRIFSSAESDYWFKKKVDYLDCPHIDPRQRSIDIEVRPEGEKSGYYRSRWLSEFATDAGEAVISMESLRACVANPPPWTGQGLLSAFCDFAGAADESALGLAHGNRVEVIDHWRHQLTTVSTGRFLNHFRRLGLQSHQLSGDQGFGYQIMDVMQESGYFLRRCNNNEAAERSEVFVNVDAERWDNFASLVARRAIILPTNDEALLHQLSSRRREYNSRGKIALESKETMRARGLHSCDLADCVIGAMSQGWGGLPQNLRPGEDQHMCEQIEECSRMMKYSRSPFHVPHIRFDGFGSH